MSVTDDYVKFKINLGQAIQGVLETDLADAAKRAMQEAVDDYVYSYDATPQAIEQRRKQAGGLSDIGNYSHDVTHEDGAYTLTVSNDTPFQGTQVDYTTLTEVVQSGNPAFHQPHERDFITPAQEKLLVEAETMLQTGLSKFGFNKF